MHGTHEGVWGSAQYGRNIGSPGQNDEGVTPRVKNKGEESRPR
jgi:hypothetical protein